MKALSIVTVCFNAEKTIQRTIESVLSQKTDDIEYIVIDGGSSDSTMGIVHSFSDQVDTVVSEPDRGIAHAFNKGIARAQGEFVALINADDWLTEGAIFVFLLKIKSTKAEIIYGNINSWRDGKIEFVAKADHRQLYKEMTVNHPAVFVRKSVYEKLGGFNENYHCAMDYEFLYRAFKAKTSFEYLDETLVNMSMDGLSDNKWMLGCMEVRKAKIEQGDSAIKTWLWFVRQITAITVVKTAMSLGLHSALQKFRDRFAKVEKQKVEPTKG